MFETRIQRKGGGASLELVLGELAEGIGDFKGWAGSLATAWYSTERQAFNTEGASIGAFRFAGSWLLDPRSCRC